EDGCLVCPWHRGRSGRGRGGGLQSGYDVRTGRMVRGPQGNFAKLPGIGAAYRLLTTVWPLGRAQVTQRNGELYIG
ncbi:MAG: hypothetical protein WCG47_20745, partial [Dermatophilaceae bacterium]